MTRIRITAERVGRGNEPVEIHDLLEAVPAWHDLAACRDADPALFHPEAGASRRSRAAQAICRGCLVSTQCLQYALDTDDQWGIYGGLTARQRRRLVHSGLWPRPSTDNTIADQEAS